MDIKSLYQTAHWKRAKHVIVIDASEKVFQGEWTEVKVSIGKEIAHPIIPQSTIRFLWE